jgi:hypothetical protein
MHVKFLITNRNKEPLYLFKVVSQCSSPLGWLSLEIRDERNERVKTGLCSVEYDMETLKLVQTLSDSKFGVLLSTDEIFGKQQDYHLPQIKGTYRLRGELAPPVYLPNDQKEDLTQHHMRILGSACLSPEVQIAVR